MIEIDRSLDRRRQTLSKLGGENALDRGDEAEVTLGELERRVASDAADEFSLARRAHGVPDQSRVALAAQPIGDDGGDA